MVTTGKVTIISAAVVDDSTSARAAVAALLQSKGMHVIASCASGDEALRMLKRHHPNVLLMDARMKGAGLDITRQIMRESPLPVILLSAPGAADGFDAQAIKAGAVAVARKPDPDQLNALDYEDACNYLLQLVRTMAGLRVVHHWGREKTNARVRPTAPLVMPGLDIAALAANLKIIGIASSTGGPSTVASIVGGLPGDFPWPVVMVQHVKLGFGSSMVDWLKTQTEMRVKLAEQGEVPQPGTILFAPDDYHLQFTTKGEVNLSKADPYKTLRPSANYLFKSLAAVYGARAMGIILTGMGDDGADGLEALYDAGGFVIGQDEESCVVYGMPRAAADMGVVTRVLSPGGIVNLLINCALSKSGGR